MEVLNMYSILVVGAGKEGKGFIGETFSTDGWKAVSYTHLQWKKTFPSFLWIR